MNTVLFLALALQHLRMEHLSQTLETTTSEDYQKLSQDFGDHIIEYLSEDTNEVIRIHSIPNMRYLPTKSCRIQRTPGT